MRVFICMCVSMCESWLYKYKVLMMAVQQLKEGRKEERGGTERERKLKSRKKV